MAMMSIIFNGAIKNLALYKVKIERRREERLRIKQRGRGWGGEEKVGEKFDLVSSAPTICKRKTRLFRISCLHFSCSSSTVRLHI